MDTVKLPTLSIPHGGGPWPWMKEAFGDPQPYQRMEDWLHTLGKTYGGRVNSLLFISAHWEETLPTVHFGPSPGMLYDYGGFPDFAYQLQWPAPGNPELSLRVEGLLHSGGFTTKRETQRGYDHGTFVPLMLAFPEAQIPVTQLSLVNSLDPRVHINLGKALEPLRSEGVLIMASGMSYHNMRGFGKNDPGANDPATAFDNWLNAAVTHPDPQERNQLLIDWAKAPGAKESHPRSEHLVPLFVAAGAGGRDLGRVNYSDILMGVPISGHIFG